MFILLHDFYTCKPVYIKVESIVAMKERRDGGADIYICSNEESFDVKETIEDIILIIGHEVVQG